MGVVTSSNGGSWKARNKARKNNVSNWKRWTKLYCKDWKNVQSHRSRAATRDIKSSTPKHKSRSMVWRIKIESWETSSQPAPERWRPNSRWYHKGIHPIEGSGTINCLQILSRSFIQEPKDTLRSSGPTRVLQDLDKRHGGRSTKITKQNKRNDIPAPLR